jgi:hypothetical protein
MAQSGRRNRKVAVVTAAEPENQTDPKDGTESAVGGRPAPLVHWPRRRTVFIFLGGVATAIGAVSGIVGIVAGVQAANAPRYATASNLHIHVAQQKEFAGSWILPPGVPLPTAYDDGLCSDATISALNREGSFDGPTVSLSLTNDFADGAAGALELDDLRARVVKSTPRTGGATEETCPTAGESAQPWLTVDLDHTKALANVDPETGGANLKVGPPSVTLDPGETVTFQITLRAEQRTDEVNIIGTLRNGRGDHSTVNLTAKNGPIEVAGDRGVAMFITPASSDPHEYTCGFVQAPGDTGTCFLKSTPSVAQLRQADVPAAVLR